MNRFHLELTMGQMRKQGMNVDNVAKEVLGLMETGISNITTLNVGIKAIKDTAIENIDLLTNKIVDEFSITYNKNNPLKSEKIFHSLFNSYNKKFDFINNKFKDR